MTNFKKFGLKLGNHTLLNQKKTKVPVAYGRTKNSVSDLASSNNAAINDVNDRISKKTLCKCECCTPMETSIVGVCYLEIPECLKTFV